MKWLAAVFIFACSLLIISGHSSAGSSGDSPPDDGIWTVDQPTFVWDEEINVDGLIVNSGTLTIENCNVIIEGAITIEAPTIWTNSSVYYNPSSGADEFEVQTYFTLKNTKVSVNLTGWNNEGIKFYWGSVITIRDYDEDPKTLDDRSEVKGDKKQNGFAFFILVDYNVQLSASNSFFGNMSLINLYSAGASFTNNSFNWIGHAILHHNHNLLFDNNTITEAWDTAVLLHNAEGPTEASYAVIKNNTYTNKAMPEYFSDSAQFVYAGSTHAKIFNNVITDSYSAIVVENDAEHAHVFSNTISNISYFCINIMGNYSKVWDNEISECKAFDGIWINAWHVEVHDNNISLSTTPLMSGFEAGYGITTSSVFRNTREDFKPTNISIYNNTISDSLRGIGIDYDIDDVFISGNIITNVTEGIKIASAEGDTCTRVPSNVIVSGNTLDAGKGIIVVDHFRQAGCFWGAHNYSFYDNSVFGGEIGFEFTGNALEKDKFFLDIEVRDNSITSTNGIIVRHIDEIIIHNNEIESNTGISLVGSLSIEITNNSVNSSLTGITAGREIIDKKSTGIINFNTVEGTGTVGIFIDEESVFSLSNNSISLYSKGIMGNISDLTIFGNVIKYSDYSVYALKSTVNIESNSFSHTDTGIHAFNSTLEIVGNAFFDYDYGYYFDDVSYTNELNNFAGGTTCYYLLDSDYIINDNGVEECNEYLLISSFRFNFSIKGDFDEPLSRDFRIVNSFDSVQLWNETDPQGSSEVYELKYLCLKANGDSEIYNPYSITIIHNGLSNHFAFNLTDKQSLSIVLDTTPPESELSTDLLLVNYNIISLNFNMLTDDTETNYLIQYLAGENSGFYEWQTLGPYNEETVNFSGEDGFSYRFRSIATDKNGNQESKTGYDIEVEFDLTSPSSTIMAVDDQDFFIVDGFKFYFRNTPTFDFQWFSEDIDISDYQIKAYHSPRMDYMEFDDFIWNRKYNEIHVGQGSDNFIFQSMGIYAFSIKCTDLATNSESKDDYDFYVLYDAIVDNITFENVPANWGSEEIIIEYLLSDPSSDYAAYLAFEPVDQKDETLEWYSVPFSNTEEFVLGNLNDRMRYFVYVLTEDRAGNINNPLNTTQYFSSNGESNQVFDLNYIPLEMSNGGELFVSIDQDLDGTYTKTLQRSETLSSMKANDYYVDYHNKKLYFGTSDGVGFIPEIGDDVIKIQYIGYHFSFSVYTRGPQASGTVEYEILDHNMTSIMWFNDEATAKCKIERTTNISKGWFNQKTISPCDIGNYTFLDTNLRSIEYKYRILYVDAFGHEGATSFVNVDMTTYQIQQTNEATTTLIDPNLILPASVLALVITLIGAILAYRFRSQEDDILLEQEAIVDSRPVAKYKIEELYLIYQDGRLVSSVSGTETSVDSDIMSGMLTAINDFVQDSFTSDEDLGSIDYGQNKIVLERGKHYYLAAVVYGKVDRFIRGQLANALRVVAANCPYLENWDGDTSQTEVIKNILNPIMMETGNVTRGMVDDYISERQVSVTSKHNVASDFLYMNINISNYSSNKLEIGKIKPIFDDRLLSLHGVKPDVLYSFNENSFQVGEVRSYTEIKFDLTFKIKAKSLAAIDIELNYFVKDKPNKTTSRVFDGQL